MSNPDPTYQYYLNNKYGKSTVIDIPAEVRDRSGEWFNQTLTTVNDAVVRLSVLKGEYHWHKHDHADEFFLVLEGQLLLDIEDQGPVTLSRHQAYTVPKSVVHRTKAPDKAVILMIETALTAPIGD